MEIFWKCFELLKLAASQSLWVLRHPYWEGGDENVIKHFSEKNQFEAGTKEIEESLPYPVVSSNLVTKKGGSAILQRSYKMTKIMTKICVEGGGGGGRGGGRGCWKSGFRYYVVFERSLLSQALQPGLET